MKCLSRSISGQDLPRFAILRQQTAAIINQSLALDPVLLGRGNALQLKRFVLRIAAVDMPTQKAV